jgi:hypothetical protein
MTTQTETKPLISLTPKAKAFLKFFSISKSERNNFARVWQNVGEITGLLFFFLFMSALLSMLTAYLLAYPNGVAGLVADLAMAAKQTPAEYIPALGAALVIMSSLFIFVMVMIARYAHIDDNPDQLFDIDDVAAMLTELTEKVDELKRQAE